MNYYKFQFHWMPIINPILYMLKILQIAYVKIFIISMVIDLIDSSKQILSATFVNVVFFFLISHFLKDIYNQDIYFKSIN